MKGNPGWRGAILLALIVATITTLIGFVLGGMWQRDVYVKRNARAESQKPAVDPPVAEMPIRGLPEGKSAAKGASGPAVEAPKMEDLRERWTNPSTERAFELPVGWKLDGRADLEDGERHIFVKADKSARVILEIIQLGDTELSAYIESAKAADEALRRAKWEALHTSGTVQLYVAKSDDGDAGEAIEREYRIWTADQSLYFRLQIEVPRNADDGTRGNANVIARRIALSSIDRPPSELAGYLF